MVSFTALAKRLFTISKGPYIHEKYGRIDKFDKLPHPELGGVVGLTCGECPSKKSMIYYTATDNGLKAKVSR